MGLDFSFFVVTSRDRVNELLETVAAFVAEEDEARLRAALPWQPSIDRVSPWRGESPARDQRGFLNLQRHSHERGEDRCFTFLFPPDEELAKYRLSCSSTRRGRDGRVPVGCVWCQIRAGDRLAVFHAVAASTDMSRLFQRSSSVRSVWSKISIEAEATALLFDFEDTDRWELLYPHTAHIPKPDEELYLFADDLNSNVDAYFEEVLLEAGIKR